MRKVVARHAAFDIVGVCRWRAAQRIEGAGAHALEAAHARFVIGGVQAQHDAERDILRKIADRDTRRRAVLVAHLFAVIGVAAEAVAVQLGGRQARAPHAVLAGQVEGALKLRCW